MSAALSDLPDDVRQILAPHISAENPAALSTLGIEIAQKRDEAKAARLSSGIESVWREAEEAYIGIDDANRHEFSDMRWAKPMSSDGPVTTGRGPRDDDNKSTAYYRMTSRYTDAGAAKLGEILLPADDKAFSFSEMPVPEVIAAKVDASQVVHSDLRVPLTRPANQNDPATPGLPPGHAPLTVRDLAYENIQIARKSAKAAETRISDWMAECQYRGEMRKVIADSARIGVGVLKAPFPKAKRVMALLKEEGGVKVIIKDKLVPAASWADPWNIYPDPACGENIHDGDYLFERDFMSARQVRGLKKLPGYISKQIDKVLEEGPDKANIEDGNNDRGRGTIKNKERFTVWYFYGTLSKDEVAAINAASLDKKPSLPEDTEEVYAIVTLINDSVVRATLNPLDSGSFPYHSVPWQRRAQHWAGIGVAEQMRAPQKIVNAALRRLLNNAGLASGIQLIIDQRALRPADGSWTIVPDKVWMTTEDAPENITQSFAVINIPHATEQLEQIIQLGERLAEEVTSIPLISQGQSGPETPDTFGAAQLQNNNANQLLRSIGYTFDDYITEPVVRQFYEWLLLDPDVPNEEKDEFQIDAHGSAALVERAIQDQTLGQMGAVVANPIYGGDPKKWLKEYLRSKKLNPDSIVYTEEEQAKLDAAPPPEAPQVTAAKIAADTQIKLGEMKLTADQQSVQSAERIEQAAQVLEGGKVQNAQSKIHVDATVELHKEQMAHERALMDYANRRNISLDQAKAQLAKTAMTLQVQKQLNAEDNAVDLHKHHNPQIQRPARGMKPPGQTPGRAGNGRAFEQGPVQ